MSDPLSTWNDGPNKSAIADFVTEVTTEGGPHFVPAAERIATFDNDGTLWVEKPNYIQLAHGLLTIARKAEATPEVRDRQPFKAVCENDRGWLGKVAADYAAGDPSGMMILLGGFIEATAGITVEAFDADALDFLSTSRHERFGVPYKQLTYTPMVELVHYLQANGFQVHLTSGGGRDFMRAVCEEIYGIPRSMAIGSSIATEFTEDAQGVAQLVRTTTIEQPIDDGPGKPPHIHRSIGRRPIMAAGNSDGDIHMLKYAAGHNGLSLSLLVHHDDADREYAYDTLSEQALQLAPTVGWIVVSMKNDWKTIFP